MNLLYESSSYKTFEPLQEIAAMLWENICLKIALDQTLNELTVTFCQMV